MKSMSELAHEFVLPALHAKALCIDGTLGYGRDSAFFLSQGVRFVHAWEIQADLCTQAKETFLHAQDRFVLHECGHEEIGTWYESFESKDAGVDAAIFNFGYNPKTLTGICTKAETSYAAVMACFEALRIKGRMALVFYPHEEGRKEYDRIYPALCSMSDADLLEIRVPDHADSPFLLCVQKRKTK